MKKRVAWVVASLFVLTALVMFWRRVQDQPHGAETQSRREAESITSKPSPTNRLPVEDGQPGSNQSPGPAQTPANATSAFWTIFSSPLSLYGKVVDQDERPIAGASVRIGVADKPWDAGSSHQRTTGPDGLFEITGVKGAGVFVGVEKEGFYAGKESRRLVQSGEMPTKDAPAIWKLYRKGQADSLILQPYVWIVMPLDGKPIEYDFNTGAFVGVGQGQLRVEVKVEASEQQRFSWWYRISLVAGGLKQRTHEFDFVAPEQGYTQVLEGRVNEDDNDWRASFGGDFFAQLPNGKFARFVCSLGGGKNSFEYRIAYAAINPTGSRNLELDPKKVRSFEP